jgi:xylulokinase
MYLGLDLGASNVKALIIDQAGSRLAQAMCPVERLHVDGGVEQDLDQIWRATIRALQQAVAAVNPAAIRAVGVSSQGGAVQLLDAEGRPLGRVISWLDQRGQPYADKLTEELGQDWLLQRIRQRRAWLSIGQLLRLRAESAEALQVPNRIGFVGDLIVERLGGRAAQDGTSAGLTLLYNPVLRAYDPDLLKRLDVQASQLPDVIPPRQAAGHLLPDVARATGLPAGIPVSPAVHDQYAAALAAGVVEAGMVMAGTGTAWVLLAVAGALPQPATDSALICHHVVDGLYGQILSLVNGGSTVTWALELAGRADAGPDEIERLLESAPPGSEGLRFWPFLAPFGASGLPPGIKGRLCGLQLSHRAPHLVRAAVEGLACELKRHLQMLEHAGMPLNRLVLTGGAAAGRVTPQILADVSGLPLACCEPSAGSVLGAALLARTLIEPERSLVELSKEMAPPARQVQPGRDASVYAKLYDEYSRSLPAWAAQTSGILPSFRGHPSDGLVQDLESEVQVGPGNG